MKYSKDGIVRFDPATHSYYRGETRLMGVTAFISRHHKKFDMMAQAPEYAGKHGLVIAEVIGEWDEAGIKGRNDGKAIHKVFEDYCETGEIQFEQGNMKQIIAVKFILDYFKTGKLIPVECEMVVYGDNLASQIDLIAKNAKDEHFIFDWKSNKEISKKGWGRTMYPPFDNYPDANFYHYSTQVSIYRKLCRDYQIKEAFIVHIGETDYDIIRAEDIKIPNHLL